MIERENLEKVVIIAVLSIPFFWFAFLTANNQIFGVDSWYWLSVGFHSTMYANFVSVLFWLSIFFLFSLVTVKKQNPYFLAGLFLLNPFALHFLEVELDDYLILLFGYIFILYFHNHPVGKWHIGGRVIALFVMLVYFLSHFGGSLLGLQGVTYASEEQRNLLILALIFPTVYVMGNNKDWSNLAVTMVLFALFLTGKFVVSGLSYFIFAVFLSYVSKEDFELGNPKIIIYILFFSIIVFYMVPFTSVEGNNMAFQMFCNPETRICNNTAYPSYGHYFAWRGYVSNVSSNFGVCHCEGDQCIGQNVTCP
jgi:hypothetical protein